MKFKKVTVAGSGVLGYQIAFQTAFHGFPVTVYDISEEALTRAKKKFEHLSDAYKKDLQATLAQLAITAENLTYTTDLTEAVQNADLLIEAIPERPELKTRFYQELAKVAPAKTVFVTNTSTLLPSQFAEATGRPDKFLALHFANRIWVSNTAEIMGHDGTDPEVFEAVVQFARAIGMLALPLHKEQPGYILNSLLVPLLDAATLLMANEVADPQTIDKTWMKATGAPLGPFAIMDVIGINTLYNVTKMAADRSRDPLRKKLLEYLKEDFIDKNKLGTGTGEGFYQYPNPAYRDKDFLQ